MSRLSKAPRLSSESSTMSPAVPQASRLKKSLLQALPPKGKSTLSVGATALYRVPCASFLLVIVPSGKELGELVRAGGPQKTGALRISSILKFVTPASNLVQSWCVCLGQCW